MASDSNDDFAGNPLMTPISQMAVDPVKSSSKVGLLGRNALEEAIPLGSPSQSQLVSKEIQSVRDATRAQNERERELKQLLRVQTEGNQTIVRRMLQKVSVAAIIVISGLVGLLFWTQLIQAISIISSWSIVPWSFAVASLVVVAGLIVASLGRLIWFVMKLRKNRPITRMLLKERAQLRETAQHLDNEAKTLLGKYMADYPLEDAGQIAFLQRWRLSDSDLESIKRNRIRLLDGGNRQDAESWQESFEVSYLRPLDEAANRIVREHSLMVGLKTAICPYSLLDMSVVIYMGSAMLGSLCRVYQLRAGPFDMMYLLGLVLGQAFFAERLEEQSDEIASWMNGTMREALEQVGGAVPDLAANMLGNLAAKGSQGLANGMLINRIGCEAIKMLRPINRRHSTK